MRATFRIDDDTPWWSRSERGDGAWDAVPTPASVTDRID
jgi:hypothetical protein